MPSEPNTAWERATDFACRRQWLIIIVIASLLAVCLTFGRLGSTPPGPTIDELSIGHNAWHIAEQGRDEHGERLPLYFKAFNWGKVGEYKNPVYIYTLAPLEHLFGPSDFVLRVPAALFALLLALALGLFIRELKLQGHLPIDERQTRWLAVALALAALTTPWCHHFGRLALEGITFPALLTWASYLSLVCRRAFSPARRYRHWLVALVAGLVWGLTLYTYSTARLLVPVLLVLLALTHLGWIRQNWPAALALTGGVLLVAIPLLVFMNHHPDALTDKFYQRTFCRPHPTDLGDLMGCLTSTAGRDAFFERYTEYVTFSYVFRRGDPNILHGVPDHGLLHLYWLPFVTLGLAWIWRHRRTGLPWFFLGTILLSPLAASLMLEHQHSLRSISALPFLLLLGALGAAELLHLVRGSDRNRRRLALGLIVGLVTLETVGYLWAYHGEYRRHLYHRHPHVPAAEAVRRAIALRGRQGYLYLPPLLAKRNPRTRRTRLTGHVSVFWRYYLRTRGPWHARNAERYRVRAGPPPQGAPPGSVAVVPARKGTRCGQVPLGFRVASVVLTPGKYPQPKYCILFAAVTAPAGPVQQVMD